MIANHGGAIETSLRHRIAPSLVGLAHDATDGEAMEIESADRAPRDGRARRPVRRTA
ncbi:Hypothetical protein A7982_04658 [Minicystis rosea]|nr:Hypothetical protein A7982_04658 [Minicystis rosea]